MAAPIHVELTAGEYVHSLRKRARLSLRGLSAALNELLPESEQVSFAWLSRYEDDGSANMTALRALALSVVIGADPQHLGIDDPAAELDRISRLVATATNATGDRRSTMRKRPSGWMDDHRPDVPHLRLVSPVQRTA
jgi:transcriptional regulator with XRE-family HTH domain